MKKVAIITILVILVFLTGCAYNELSNMAKEYKKNRQEREERAAPVRDLVAEAPEDVASEEGSEEIVEERLTVETDDSEDVTFKKLPDYKRDKAETEICDLDYPIECTKFLAKDGIEYITIKNAGYTSKINDVELRLNGEACDPTGSYIEPGQLKEFECYADEGPDGYVRGDFEMEYYSPIEQRSFVKEGTLVVLME